MENYEMEMVTQDKESEDIMRCLHTLLGIRAGSQPADRELGISWECLDSPPETAEALFLVELEDKVEKYEPRAVVVEVTFRHLVDGKLRPHIIFAKKEGAA